MVIRSCGGPAASWSEPRSASPTVPDASARSRSATDSSRGSSSPERRRARMTAPTAATSSSSEAISNASRNLVRNSSPDLRPARRSPRTSRALLAEHAQAGAEHRDRRSRRTARPRTAARSPRMPGPVRPASGRLLPADVGDHEHVQHHHRAGVDDHLRGGDELRPQQQEERGQRRAGGRRARAPRRTGCAGARSRSPRRGRPIAAMKKKTSAIRGAGGYSPAVRSGVRSSGSASSISLVKMRSERL